MKIRQAELGDAAQLAALHAALFPSAPWGEPYWRMMCGSQDHLVTLTEAEEAKIVACCAVHCATDEAEILICGTSADHQRQGVAGALLSHTLSCLHDRGVAATFLEVAVTNAAAIALYNAQGFSVVGQRKDYYGPGEDAHVMKR